MHIYKQKVTALRATFGSARGRYTIAVLKVDFSFLKKLSQV